VNAANTPNLEAWAAIEELGDNKSNIPAVYTTEHPIHQPKVEIELYDSGALRHMSPFLHQFKNYCTIVTITPEVPCVSGYDYVARE
jgi:hypothetical protein